MEELVQVRRNEAVCTSLQIAENFKKDHKRVLQDIREMACSEEFRGHNFVLSSYVSSQNKELPMYYITRDGFTLLVMGFTGKKAMKFKEDYIKAFNSMERLLFEKKSEHWQLERKQGKLSRKAETDALKELVAYAEAHGSKNANMLYITYSKLANATVGIKSRDLATAEQLSELSVVEQIILKSVKEGIRMQMDYHDIYKATKERLTMFRQLAYLV